MIASERATAQQRRQSLLDGLLLRLARLPDAHDFVLRGGMLMRLWFRPLCRPVGDLDLVATFPFDVDEAARRLVPILADDGSEDGLRFDPDRYRVEGIWPRSTCPGVRLFTSGAVEGIECDFTVDVTFGEPLIPPPVICDYPIASSAVASQLRMCRPETILGRKLHALFHMGRLHWRPKDLNDLRLLLDRVTLRQELLPAAIKASFTSRGCTSEHARGLFGSGSWWSMKTSRARWHDFVTYSSWLEVPRDLSGVIADVAKRLEPFLEQLP